MTKLPANPAYQEILRLASMLENAGIEHVMERKFDGWHLMYPDMDDRCVCSVIEFTGSYGASMDRLEIMGLLNAEERKYASVCGYLTAENVFNRIKSDSERRKKRRKTYIKEGK